MIPIALGIAFGVALIPLAFRIVNGVPSLLSVAWRVLTHPLVWVTGLLLLGACWHAATEPIRGVALQSLSAPPRW